MATKIRLRNARAAFVEVGAPDYYQGKKQRDSEKRAWSVAFICSKDTEALGPDGVWGPAKQVIDKAIAAEAGAKWGPKAASNLASILSDPKACCLTNGDRKPDYAGYPGNWILAAKRTEDKGRPLVFDKTKQCVYPTKDQWYTDGDGTQRKYESDSNTPCLGMAGKIYSGCYVAATVSIWAQAAGTGFGAGMRCELVGVQVTRDGDAFGGGMPASSAADDFDDISQGADAGSLA